MTLSFGDLKPNPSNMSSDKPLVLVTGASGFVGSWVVKVLLDSGRYRVRGTVRDVKNAEKTEHLRKLFPDLELVESDLMKDGTFDDAVKDCEIVFHTASPFQIRVDDPQRDLVDPAVNGTKNVLAAIEKTGQTVRRVVLTSSVAAIRRTGEAADYVFDEKDWNTTCSLQKGPYEFSKVSAEKVAWEAAKGAKWTLSVVNPSFILGPTLSRRIDGTSCRTIKQFLEGTIRQPIPFTFAVVSVVDVAIAHLRAAESDEAQGHRHYIGSPRSYGYKDFLQFLTDSGKYKAYPLQNNQVKDNMTPLNFDNARVLKALGFAQGLVQPEVAIVEMADSLIALGAVAEKSSAL